MTNLSIVLRRYRLVGEIELKDLAAEIGVNPSTLSRFERDGSVSADNLSRILIWLLATTPTNQEETDGKRKS